MNISRTGRLTDASVTIRRPLFLRVGYVPFVGCNKSIAVQRCTTGL
jgi:hypothetical protein